MKEGVQPNIVLIDDNNANIEGLNGRLRAILPENEAEIRLWIPTEGDGDSRSKFDSLVDENTILVITDYDLSPGYRGLFGYTIVGWCQSKSIPVGDFSRGNIKNLPSEPNLFELRIPLEADRDAKFIASTFRGFKSIFDVINARPELLVERYSLSAVLASILERDNLDSQFSMYMSRIGSANSNLTQKLIDIAASDAPNQSDKARLLGYVAGHILLNSIMKFPGPILSDSAICAYMTTIIDEADEFEVLFKSAAYSGPFDFGSRFYWKDSVDYLIDQWSADIDGLNEVSAGDFNRHVVEKKLGRALRNHDCDRCSGTKGGYWCPFTLRPVCEQSNCSVQSSSWIPQGAVLCRVERTFYDEMAPILGL